jgi:hypothetical protein
MPKTVLGPKEKGKQKRVKRETHGVKVIFKLFCAMSSLVLTYFID